MTQQNTLQLLWEKYINDRPLDASEIRQLKELIQDESNREVLTGLLNSAYNTDSPIPAAEYSSQDAFKEVCEKLQLRESKQPSTVVTLAPRRNWWKYAAAAVLLIGIGFAAYQMVVSDKNERVAEQQPAQQPHISIQPGGNKAMLILDDGSIVKLEDIENGVVANQGGAKIIKHASGELVYEKGSGNTASVGYNTFVTPRGGKHQLTLPDGSKVWMNAESSLRYPTSFIGNTREVSLTGEAYFEVAHNAKQPFHVKVKDIKVAVLGTHFDIMAYENEGDIATTLVEGAVLVRSATQQLKLKPGQQGLQTTNGSMKLADSVDLQQVLAWKNDYFHLNGDRLDRLMRQLERWYDISVVFEGPIPDRKFGGKIPRSSELTDVLKALELSDVKFRVSGRKITVINN